MTGTPEPRGYDAGTTTVRDLARVGGPGGVVLRRVETPKGERLEVETADGADRIRLDAIALECLAWQDEATFERFLAGDDGPGGPTVVDPPATDAGASVEDLTAITNEFAHATVRAVSVPDGDLVEVAAPKRGHSAHLTPAALAAVAAGSEATFSDLIRYRVE